MLKNIFDYSRVIILQCRMSWQLTHAQRWNGVVFLG